MSTHIAQYVFNLQAFLVGSLTMLVCLIVQAAFAHVVTLRMKPWLADLVAKRKHYTAQTIFLICALILLFSHLLQIYIWGESLNLAGIESNPHHAVVFAGSTYTTVGFVNDPLPLQWQLITIIMATSGLFSFGWSTSVMFLLAQTLYPSEK